MEKIKWRTRFDRLPFLVRVVWDMPRALDMVDAKGEPDHAKMLPYFLLVAVVVLKVFSITFSMYELIILAALTGGISTVRLLIKSGVLTGLKPPKEGS